LTPSGKSQSHPTPFSVKTDLTLPHTIPIGNLPPGLVMENKQLGSPVVQYMHPVITRPVARVLMILAGALLVFALGIACLYIYAWFNFGTAVAVKWIHPWVMISLFFGLFWLILFMNARMGKKAVMLFQNGFSIWRNGKKTIPFYWHEISGISFAQEEWRFMHLQKSRNTAKLHLKQGRTYNLLQYCPVEHLPEFITYIKAKIYPHLEPDLRRMLWNGDTINFGELAISKDNLSYKSRNIPWSQISSLDIQEGALLVLSRNSASQSPTNSVLKIPVKFIPNIDLFPPLSRIAAEIGFHNPKSSMGPRK
jgi:hypothetical protein